MDDLGPGPCTTGGVGAICCGTCAAVTEASTGCTSPLVSSIGAASAVSWLTSASMSPVCSASLTSGVSTSRLAATFSGAGCCTGATVSTIGASSSASSIGPGARTSRSAGAAAAPAAATSFTASPVFCASWPPGSAGRTRISPSAARTTGMPDTSRITRLYPQTPTPAISATDATAPARFVNFFRGLACGAASTCGAPAPT